jgi:hypothetical protein
MDFPKKVLPNGNYCGVLNKPLWYENPLLQLSGREPTSYHITIYSRPARITQCCDLQLQRNNQSPQIQVGVAILTNSNQSVASSWTDDDKLPSALLPCLLLQVIQAFMQHVRVQRFTLADQKNCVNPRNPGGTDIVYILATVQRILVWTI